MRCFPNYNPNPPTPIGRITSRCIYEQTPYIIPQIQRKLQVLKNKSSVTQNSRYAYLVNNPVKTYGVQSDVYTNPNILGVDRIGATTISINNNPTCPYEYPISDPAAFPSNQTSVVYPTHPVIPTNIPPCINYTALAGGILSVPSCIP